MKKTPKRGRPPTGRVARNVYLEPKQLEAVREYGGGNTSAGVRILIDQHLLKRGRRK
jgi:hypothetical protein